MAIINRLRKGLGSTLAVAGAVLALALPGGAGADARMDHVRGTAIGQMGAGTPVTYDLAVDSGPKGQHPEGFVRADDPFGGLINFFFGPVTCLNVQGNVALLKLESTESDSGVIGLVSMRITDNAGSTTPDLIEATFATGASDECALPETSYILTSTVISGDVVVEDDGPKCWFRVHLHKPPCPPLPPDPDEPPA